MSYRSRLPLGQPTLSEILAALTAGERLLFGLAAANFISFVILWFVIGGNALNGGMDDGRYFLGAGRSREVSGFVYGYSLAHTLSLLVTHPIGMFIDWRGRRRVLKDRSR